MPVLFLTSNGAPSQTATWTSSLRASPEEAFMVPAPLAQSLAEESWSGPCPLLGRFSTRLGRRGALRWQIQIRRYDFGVAFVQFCFCFRLRPAVFWRFCRLAGDALSSGARHVFDSLRLYSLDAFGDGIYF